MNKEYLKSVIEQTEKDFENDLKEEYLQIAYKEKIVGIVKEIVDNEFIDIEERDITYNKKRIQEEKESIYDIALTSKFVNKEDFANVDTDVMLKLVEVTINQAGNYQWQLEWENENIKKLNDAKTSFYNEFKETIKKLPEDREPGPMNKDSIASIWYDLKWEIKQCEQRLEDLQKDVDMEWWWNSRKMVIKDNQEHKKIENNIKEALNTRRQRYYV